MEISSRQGTTGQFDPVVADMIARAWMDPRLSEELLESSGAGVSLPDDFAEQLRSPIGDDVPFKNTEYDMSGSTFWECGFTAYCGTYPTITAECGCGGTVTGGCSCLSIWGTPCITCG